MDHPIQPFVVLKSRLQCGGRHNIAQGQKSVQPMIKRMRGASQRSEIMSSPAPRSRSQERSLDEMPIGEMHLDDITASTESENDSHVAVPYLHQRAMSDPVDASEVTTHERKHTLLNETFPTLPRYPIGATHDKNCWSEPAEDIFKVRGVRYLRDESKVVSGPYLMRARGADLLLVNGNPPEHIGRFSAVLGGTLRKIPTFIVNFRFPWGLIALYWEIPFKLLPYLRPNPPPMDDLTRPEKTMARFFMGDDNHRNSTLKLIPYIPEGPWIARNMVTGQPAIIGNKLPVTYTYAPASNGMAEYLEADLDIGSSSKAARRIVSVCRRYMNALTVDIGFVIQGNTEEELPEQMLGSIRLHGPDPLKAPTLS